MTRIRSWVALVLALLWTPVTAHCLLEDAGLIHRDECCQPTNSPTDADHDAADGVCQIETGKFHLPKPGSIVAGIPVSMPWQQSVPPADAVLRPQDSLIATGTSPPAILGRTWQFARRAALPPRAPSAAS